MKKVRFGVIGMGNMGIPHARNIVSDKHKDFVLGAVCDLVEETAARIGGELGVPYFSDPQAMYESGLIDAVIIAVPHYSHAPLAVRAAQAGIHVLCEKPLAVTVGAARTMIQQCRKHKVALGAMLQMRTRGIMMKAKEMIESGKLGEVFRVSMVCSSWYRTQFYYDSGAWRGTWDGEGGGILLNQAPHSLDLFQWLGGMPKRIVATVGTRLHKIEVENTANAICEYEGGKTGYIYATTAEAPGIEQFAFSGDKGTLIAEEGKLRFAKLKQPISKHIMACKQGFAKVPYEWQEVTWTKDPGGKHINIIRNFASHLLRKTPLIAPGQQAINELELSNAIYIAGFKNEAVELPVDAGEIERLIAQLEREYSTGKGGRLRSKADKELKALLK